MDATILGAQTDAAVNQARIARLQQQAAATRHADPQRAREAAVKFEGMFLAQLLRPMFDTIEVDPTFGGGNAERMWRSLMVDEYGKAIARAGGIGLADAVQREILMMQEVK
jgi:Rod binding domain-containing protein